MCHCDVTIKCFDYSHKGVEITSVLCLKWFNRKKTCDMSRTFLAIIVTISLLNSWKLVENYCNVFECTVEKTIYFIIEQYSAIFHHNKNKPWKNISHWVLICLMGPYRHASANLNL